MDYFFKKGREDLPTFVLLHGTGGDEYSMLSVHSYIEPDSTVLAPRGKVKEFGHNRYFKRLQEGVYDEKDLFERAVELREFIVKMSTEKGFDLENIVLLGFSNGANIAINLLLEHSDIFTRAILLSPMYPLEVSKRDLSKTKVFMSAGKVDRICSVQDSEYVREIFEKNNAKVSIYWGYGHELTKEILDVAREFLTKIDEN